MAEPQLSAKIDLRGLKEVIDDLSKMGEEGKKAFEEIEKALKRAEREMGDAEDATDGVRKGFEKMASEAVASGRKIAAGFAIAIRGANGLVKASARAAGALGRVGRAGVGGAVKGGAAAGAGLGVASIGMHAAAKSALEYYQEIEGVSAATGVSINRIEVLGEAFRRMGYEMDDLQGGLQNLNTVWYDTLMDPGGEKEQWFKLLGIDRKQLKSFRSLNEVTDAVVLGLGRVQNQNLKVNLADQLLGGDDGSRFIRALGDGVQGLRQIRHEMRLAGTLYDPKNVAALKAYKNEWSRLGTMVRGVFLEGAAQYAPGLTQQLNILTRLIYKYRAEISRFLADSGRRFLILMQDLLYVLGGRPDLVRNTWLLKIPEVLRRLKSDAIGAYHSFMAFSKMLAEVAWDEVQKQILYATAAFQKFMRWVDDTKTQIELFYRLTKARLIPIFEEIGRLWREQLEPVWTEFWKLLHKVADGIGEVFGVTGTQVLFLLFLSRVTGVLGIMLGAVGLLKDVLMFVFGGGLLKTAGKLLPYLKTLGGWIGRLVAMLGAAVASMVSWPVLLAAAIGAVIGLVVGYVITHWEQVKQWWSEFWTWSGERWDEFAAWFRETFPSLGEVWDSIVDAAYAAWDRLPGIFDAAWESIKSGFMSVIEWFRDQWNGLWQWVGSQLASLKAMISDATGGLFGGGTVTMTAPDSGYLSQINSAPLPAAPIVQAPVPQHSFSRPSGTPLAIHMDGSTFMGSADSDVASELRRKARQNGRLRPAANARWE